MIELPRGVSVYAFDEPCDMRQAFDTVTALVTEHMKHDVLLDRSGVYADMSPSRLL